MATNYVQEGDVLDFTAAAAVASGAVIVLGKRIGVAARAVSQGSVGAAHVTGVWEIAKLTTDVVGQGDLLYWDAQNSRLTTTAASNVQAGYAASPAAAGAATVQIKING
ncbi:putative RecA/RadA family phage recombinase [Duganella sp. 1224]|uniref:DUF2190 family protein n=1 Tax=Duganella sp. 1224 TaxID=2587052 RepID=UPI0015C98CD1|nr:DUF2190 family protein [Duganella sp. 1224]NYE62193.1 putative RecA/RadA family phage recombinase [Duganella sp. 1224]